MDLLAAASFALSMLAGIAVGGRLLLLARRTRGLPEVLVGTALLSYGIGIQVPAALLVSGGEALEPGVGFALFIAWIAGSLVTYTGLCAFTWATFRRGVPWANAWVCLLILAGMVVHVQGLSAWDVSILAGGTTPAFQIWQPLGNLGYALAFGWAAWESLRYHAMIRRREALGIREPVLANRFLVWGVGCTCAAGLIAAVGVCGLMGLNPMFHSTPRTLVTAAGLVNAAVWSLAFSPPRAYLDFLEQRDVTPGAEA